MATFVLLCTFTGFCGLSGCPEGHGDITVQTKLDPDLLVAELWLSPEPGAAPLPAIVQRTGTRIDEWALFTASATTGQWMMTVVPSSGAALLSYQDLAFSPDVRGARGTCQITEEAN